MCGWNLDPGSCNLAFIVMPELTLWVCCPAEQLLLNSVLVYVPVCVCVYLCARVLSGVEISMIRPSAVNQCHEWCTNQTRCLS